MIMTVILNVLIIVGFIEYPEKQQTAYYTFIIRIVRIPNACRMWYLKLGIILFCLTILMLLCPLLALST